MNKCAALLLVSIFLILGLIPAPSEDKILHTVDFPKSDAAWIVTFDEDPGLSEMKLPKSSQMDKIEIVRKGSVSHDVVTWKDGTTQDYWRVTDIPLVVYWDRSAGRITAKTLADMGSPAYDQSLFSWVSASTYKGMQPFHGKQCRYYEMKYKLLNDDEATMRAWIDNQTAMPTAWTNSGRVALFSFDAPLPDGPLVMPKDYLNELNRIAPAFGFRRRASVSSQ